MVKEGFTCETRTTNPDGCSTRHGPEKSFAHCSPSSAKLMTAEGNVDTLVHGRFFENTPPGTMLEIGAARPDWLSIGALFRSRGWDVLSVEPNPLFASLHRDLGHDVAEVALAANDCDAATFTIVDCGGQPYRDGQVSYESFSSLGFRGKFSELSIPDHRQEISVRVCRADTILGEFRPGWVNLDLVAVDIEGWELEALSGLDFEKYRPRIVILENLCADGSYRSFMRDRGYILWRSRFPNEIYACVEELKFGERLWALVIAAPGTAIRRLRLSAAIFYRRRSFALRSNSS